MLTKFDGSKQNNLTLLRLIFALAVLFGHAYPITGSGSDPLIGSYTSVYVGWWNRRRWFFIISGYLVTASFQTRRIWQFTISRILRLWPAVTVYCILSILIVGPLFAQVPLKIYFDANPYAYLWNASLWDWKYNLPYVFSSNPFSGSTNGATWTLPVEVRRYAILAVIGFFGALENRYRANVALVVLFVYINRYEGVSSLGCEERATVPVGYFLLGALARVNRTIIPLNLISAALAAILAIITVGTALHLYILEVCLAYIIFILTYQAKRVNMDGFGDISYGVYIYAWPVQQAVWSPGQSGLTNALSTLIVLPLAYASWRLVEKSALGLRKYFTLAEAKGDQNNSNISERRQLLEAKVGRI
jgi:peptidoglycan/LPS O-acetylase OafA/YrhL